MDLKNSGRHTYVSKFKNNLTLFSTFLLKQVDLPPNVCFIKIRNKHSSNTLMSLLRIFMKQTLLGLLSTHHPLHCALGKKLDFHRSKSPTHLYSLFFTLSGAEMLQRRIADFFCSRTMLKRLQDMESCSFNENLKMQLAEAISFSDQNYDDY